MSSFSRKNVYGGEMPFYVDVRDTLNPQGIEDQGFFNDAVATLVARLTKPERIITAFVFSPVGMRLAIASSDGVSNWPLDPLSLIAEIAHGNKVVAVSFESDGSLLVARHATAKSDEVQDDLH